MLLSLSASFFFELVQFFQGKCSPCTAGIKAAKGRTGPQKQKCDRGQQQKELTISLSVTFYLI